MRKCELQSMRFVVTIEDSIGLVNWSVRSLDADGVIHRHWQTGSQLRVRQGT